jgi:hypothetical protein
MPAIVNGLAAGVSGGLAAVIQQSIGTALSGSVVSVAVSGMAGAYLSVMFDLVRQWLTTHGTHATLPSPSYAENPDEGGIV